MCRTALITKFSLWALSSPSPHPSKTNESNTHEHEGGGFGDAYGYAQSSESQPSPGCTQSTAARADQDLVEFTSDTIIATHCSNGFDSQCLAVADQ